MPKVARAPAPTLLDAIRPTEADGPLYSFVCSTYGLSLEEPDFFGQDFLPTLLGVGSVRGRGLANPGTVERKLKEVSYAGLIVDAHALAETGRPSLQIDVLPVGPRPTHRMNHAKVVFLHRKRLIRLIVTSANLTHGGYRRQREVGVILDFKDKGSLPLSILTHALDGWRTVLDNIATESLRQAFAAAVKQAKGWELPRELPTGRKVRVVFGGGAKPLWESLVEAWPTGEPVFDWCVCSPFWPEPSDARTPFEELAAGLAERGADLTGAELRLLTRADAPGECGQPCFPFRLLQRLAGPDFPVHRGCISPVRLESLPTEVPEGMAEGSRDLHAKWVLLRGPKTVVALVGSANFTRRGLGVLPHPKTANIEACVLLTLPAAAVDLSAWIPPLVERGIVDLAAVEEGQLREPLQEEEDNPPWPAFLARVELTLVHGDGIEPTGTVQFVLRPGTCPAFQGYLPPGPSGDVGALFLEVTEGAESVPRTPVNEVGLSRLLAARSVVVRWSGLAARFPINIEERSKTELPSVLGAQPDELQLLAYFHGRISEEELAELLEKQAAQRAGGASLPTHEVQNRLELQNYLLRDFVEGLFGLSQTLQQSLGSQRAFEQALLGEFSPMKLAEQIVRALRHGKRTATAAAFQLVELIRVVAGLPLGGEALTPTELNALKEVQQRAVDRLLRLAATAADDHRFEAISRNSEFRAFIRASLPKHLARSWPTIVDGPPAAEPKTETRAEPSLT